MAAGPHVSVWCTSNATTVHPGINAQRPACEAGQPCPPLWSQPSCAGAGSAGAPQSVIPSMSPWSIAAVGAPARSCDAVHALALGASSSNASTSATTMPMARRRARAGRRGERITLNDNDLADSAAVQLVKCLPPVVQRTPASRRRQLVSRARCRQAFPDSTESPVPSSPTRRAVLAMTNGLPRSSSLGPYAPAP